MVEQQLTQPLLSVVHLGVGTPAGGSPFTAAGRDEGPKKILFWSLPARGNIWVFWEIMATEMIVAINESNKIKSGFIAIGLFCSTI